MFVAALRCASVAQADPPGFIFWDNLDTGRIGRANIDGRGVKAADCAVGAYADRRHLRLA
jgi:hypothetical protein